MGNFRSLSKGSVESSGAILRFAAIAGNYSTILGPAIGLPALPTAVRVTEKRRNSRSKLAPNCVIIRSRESGGGIERLERASLAPCIAF